MGWLINGETYDWLRSTSGLTCFTNELLVSFGFKYLYDNPTNQIGLSQSRKHPINTVVLTRGFAHTGQTMVVTDYY